TGALLEDGFDTVIEVSAHPVLTVPMRETVEAVTESPDRFAVLHTMRREEGGERRFLVALAEAHVEGGRADFSSRLAGRGATAVELRTYPFQRRRFWLEQGAGAGDASALGQAATEHPLLGASIALASDGSRLFTGRISLRTHPWLADHAVAGT